MSKIIKEEGLYCLNCGHENINPRENCEICNCELMDYNDPLSVDPRSVEDDDSDVDPDQRRPWVRYFARLIDYSLFGLIAQYVLIYLIPSEPFLSNMIYSILLILSWIPFEAALISSLGTTPGKFLFNITVRTTDGDKLSFPQAFYRAFGVFYRGMALGVPVFSLLATLNAYGRLMDKGRTVWDLVGQYKVLHNQIGLVRAILCTLAVLSVFGQRFFILLLNRGLL